MTITRQQLEEKFILQASEIDELVKHRAAAIGPDEALEIFYSATQIVGAQLEEMDKSKVNRLNRLSMAARVAFMMGYNEALEALVEAHAAALEALR